MEMNIVDFLQIVLKRIWIIITAAILSFTLALSYCVFIAKPVYSAKATVLIASGVLFKDDDFSNSEYITTGELSTSFALMKSISGILTQSMDYYETALKVAEKTGKLNHKYSVSALKSGTSISYEEESIILTLKVRTYDREDTAILIAALAECAPVAVTSRLGRTSAVVLNIDSKAGQVAPNTATSCLLALLVGIALSVAAVITYEKLDKTVKSEDDFTQNHKIPLLGCVPDFDIKNHQRRARK